MDTLGLCNIVDVMLMLFFFNRWRAPSSNISLKPQIIHLNSYNLAYTACGGCTADLSRGVGLRPRTGPVLGEGAGEGAGVQGCAQREGPRKRSSHREAESSP